MHRKLNNRVVGIVLATYGTHLQGGSVVVSVQLFLCTNIRKNIFKLSNVRFVPPGGVVFIINLGTSATFNLTSGTKRPASTLYYRHN